MEGRRTEIITPFPQSILPRSEKNGFQPPDAPRFSSEKGGRDNDDCHSSVQGQTTNWTSAARNQYQFSEIH